MTWFSKAASVGNRPSLLAVVCVAAVATAVACTAPSFTPPPPPPPPAPVQDSAELERARRDSIAAIEHARADSIARARAEEAHRRAEEEARRRVEQERLREDSARAAAHRPTHDRTGTGHAPTPPPDHAPTLAEQKAQFDSASVNITSPNPMRLREAESVSIAIVIDSMVKLTPAGDARSIGDGTVTSAHDGLQTVYARTQIGDIVTVCLRADTTSFRISGGDSTASGNDGRCTTSTRLSRAQGTTMSWEFRAEPLDTGRSRDLTVDIATVLRGYPSVKYEKRYTVQVDVGAPTSILPRIRNALKAGAEWLDDSTHFLAAVAALLAGMTAVIVAWQKLRLAAIADRAVTPARLPHARAADDPDDEPVLAHNPSDTP